MYSFQYRKAKTLQEAADWLAKDEDAKALSGGMTLLPTLKARLAQPSQLIDIAGLAELAGLFGQAARAPRRHRRPPRAARHSVRRRGGKDSERSARIRRQPADWPRLRRRPAPGRGGRARLRRARR
ncbi:MAG: FAD binding domain-containing protein [Steroidobacteraceae bacterium]